MKGVAWPLGVPALGGRLIKWMIKQGAFTMDAQEFEALVSKAGNVVTCFIPIIGKFIEWVNMPKGTEKEAVDSLVKSINENQTLSPVAKAASITEVKQIIRQYKNQHDIVEIAIKELSAVDAPLENISEETEEEWISRFMESAAHVSEPSVQLMWGKILANKFLSPDDTPKVMIHILSTLDYKVAEAFQNLCRFVIRDGELFFPFVLWEKNKFYQNHGILFHHLLELCTAGLISSDYMRGYVQKMDDRVLQVSFNNKIYEIKSNNEAGLPFGNISFTEAGECLYKAISPEAPPDDFLDMCIDYWKNNKEYQLTCSEHEEI